jgi:hypothetical protein
MLPKNNFLTSNTINNVYNTQTCTSVSQYGITWTFDRAYTCGQFVNGDWWVVGPVKITAITSSISTITGAQINIIPTGMPRDDKTNFQDQGLIKFRGKGLTDLSNAKGFRYSASKDLTTQLPYIIPNNSSVITGLHTSDPWVDVKVAFRDIAILTVLDTIPRQ